MKSSRVLDAHTFDLHMWLIAPYRWATCFQSRYIPLVLSCLTQEVVLSFMSDLRKSCLTHVHSLYLFKHKRRVVLYTNQGENGVRWCHCIQLLLPTQIVSLLMTIFANDINKCASFKWNWTNPVIKTYWKWWGTWTLTDYT
jgi:hypothetical protein